MAQNQTFVCPGCGYVIDISEIHEGFVTCEACLSELKFDNATNSLKKIIMPGDAIPANVSQVSDDTGISNIKESETAKETASKKRYFVHCEDSDTDTYIDDPDAKYFFCEGCHEEHEIDGLDFYVQEKIDSSVPTGAAHKSKNIVELTEETQNAIDLKVLKSGMEGEHLDLICDTLNGLIMPIPKEGGIIGREGTIMPDKFAGFRTISRRHLRIYKEEHGKWMIEHLSQINDTEYDGIKMQHEKQLVLSDGKKIILSKFLQFTVHIY